MKFMKKTLAVVLAVAMLVLAVPFSATAASNPTITVSSTSAYPGKSAQVKIDISNNPGIIAMLIKVEYDATSLTLTKIENGTTLPGGQHSTTQLNKNPFIINFANDLATENITSNGTIVTLTFDVKEDAEIGNADVKVSYDNNNAGIYNIDMNTVDFDVVNGGVKVLGKDLPKITAKNKSVVYDGTVKNIDLTGVPDNASVNYTVDGEAFSGTKHVGTYNVTANVTAPGYNPKTVNATLTITPKTLTVKGLKAVSKQYDGTTVAQIDSTDAYFDGVIGTDEVFEDIPKVGTFASANAGKGIAVAIGNVGIGAKDAHNYTLTQPTLKADITPVDIAIEAKSYTIKKGQSVPSPLEYVITEGSLVNENDISGKLATKGDGKKEGTFDITVGTLKLTSNYNLKSFKNGTLTVADKEKQDVKTPVIEGVTYGGNKFNLGVQVGNKVSSASLTYKSETPSVVSVDENGNVTVLGAGDAKITVSKAGDDTYADFSETVSFKVEPKSINIEAHDKTVSKGGEMPELTYYVDGLVGNDEVKATLSTTAKNTNTAGEYPIQVKVNAKNYPNYKINAIDGTLYIVEKETQNIIVDTSTIPQNLTYGDSSFKLNVSLGSDVSSKEVTYKSETPSVVTVDSVGNVTIVGAGNAKVTVSKAGDDTYADFSETVSFEVNKKAITVKADNKTVRKGADMPELTYTVDGLVDGDKIEATLSTTAKNTNTLKEYPITVKVDEKKYPNYKITTVNGTLNVVDKNVQNVSLTGVPENVTYGDDAFNLTASSSEVASQTVTYKSSNTDVVSVDANGRVSVVGAGEATISAEFAGNDDYSKATASVSVVVGKKEITIKRIGTGNDTTESGEILLDGVLEKDKENVEVDKSKVKFETEYPAPGMSRITFSNFVLMGSASKNYVLTTTSYEGFRGGYAIRGINLTAETGGSVTGGGAYLEGAVVTVKATPNKGYKFDGWYNGEEKVSSSAEYEVTVGENTITLTAKFKKTTTQGSVGGGGTATRTVYFESEGNETTKVIVDKGDKLNAPEDPVREGYTFGGWYTDKDFTTEYNFNEKVTASFTLYAKWTKVEDVDDKKPDENGDDKDDNGDNDNKFENPFKDVNEKDWFYKSVMTVYEKGLMNGVKKDEFAPKATLSRAMLITILYRAVSEPECGDVNVPFVDVDENAYYMNALIWAYENEIVMGITDTTFAPNEDVTREQIAAIALRFAQYMGLDALTLQDSLHFEDNDRISPYAVSAVNWLVGLGIFEGYEDNTIRPQNSATRAETATLICRALELFA